MELNDGSQYRVVTDPARHMREREVFCFRAASARNDVPYVDTAFSQHRSSLAPMPGLLMYQFVYQDAGSPEEQADFFLTQCLGGGLYTNEMVMLDIEVGGGFTNPADFAKRWLAIVESALDTRAWLYVPRALSAALQPITDGRIVMAPRYSGTPYRGLEPNWPWEVHQYTDQGYFPGCTQSGDTSFTNLTVAQMLTRCNPNGIPVPPAHSSGGA